MGALKGSCTYLRFLVDGEPPKGFADLFEQAIEARRFLPLSEGAPEEESAGWVPIDAPYDDEASITRERFWLGHLIALAYREDRISLPRPLVQHHVQKRLEELREKGERITRKRRDALELAVVRELRRKALPKSRVVEVVWDYPRRELRVFGRGPIAKERVAAHFERTFALRVTLATYAARAFSLDLSLRARSVLEGLAPKHVFDDVAPRIEETSRATAEETALEEV